MYPLLRIFSITLVVWIALCWLLLGKAALQATLDIQMHNTYFVLHSYSGQLILFLMLLSGFALGYLLLRFLRSVLNRHF